MKNNPLQNKEGVILVLTLIVMSVLMSIAIGFGVVIISDIRQSASIDNSMVAYFAADAGLEKNLFLLRKQDNINSVSNVSTTQSLIESSSVWTVASSSDFEATFFRQRIKNGQGVKMFFLGRESGQNLTKSVDVYWNKSIDNPTRMQISFTRLKPEAADNVFKTDLNEIFITTTTKNCFDFVDIPSVSDYVVEVKALGSADGFIDNLTVMGYDGKCDETRNYTTTSINNITLISEGKHGNATQRIIAYLPPRTIISNIFSFVLFSEEDITKR
ncbi:MAG: hypothetical protein WCV92_01465 [Candidatus Buchananbacteria bacterium]